ncbi:MAG TPA: nuclear transport factor 2 family protein [Kofleriaceae bacterium]|nr:nuclear transport factor 2 family protein [Kofleriaceae bacterium]
MRRLALAMVMWWAGCTGSAAPITRQPVDTSIDQTWGTADLRHDLEATVLETYAQLGLGNIAAYAATLSSELPVTLFGIEPFDVVTGKKPAGARRDRRLYPRRAISLYTKILEVHMAPEKDLAWTYDEVSLRVPVNGEWASIPIRISFAFVREVGRWAIVMEQRSYALPISDILERAREGHLTAPRSIYPTAPEGKAATAIRRTLDELVTGEDPERRREILSSDEGALLVLPGIDNEYHGEAIVNAPSLSQIFGPDSHAEIKQLRLFISDTKDAAWAAANLELNTHAGDRAVRIGLRGTYVLMAGDGHWRVVQSHVSVPITEKALSARVFSGAIDGDGH